MRVAKQHGFSILELMISLLLGLVVIAGIVQLFVGNSRTYELVTAQSRLQESARYSYEFITEAARNAGYFGCAPEAEFVVKLLNGAWATIPEYDISNPVDGFEANGDGSYGPTNLLTLPRSEGGGNLNVHINGNGIDSTTLETDSDILILRSVRQPVARLNDTLFANGLADVSTPGGQPVFAANDVVMVTDCEQSALFRVSGVVLGANNTVLERDTGASNFDNSAGAVITLGGEVITPATLSVGNISYDAAATVGVVETTIFFVAPSTVANDAGVNINSLWRKQGSAAPVELVQGVDNMQVFYGIDSTLDNTANVNRYQTISAPRPANSSIVAVRVRLDIVSPEALAENGGNPLQRTFTKTISIRNGGV